jgi:hypothetical protein
MMGVGFASGFGGRVNYSITPISIKLRLYAELFWKRWSKTIASWSSKTYRKTLLSL